MTTQEKIAAIQLIEADQLALTKAMIKRATKKPLPKTLKGIMKRALIAADLQVRLRMMDANKFRVMATPTLKEGVEFNFNPGGILLHRNYGKTALMNEVIETLEGEGVKVKIIKKKDL